MPGAKDPRFWKRRYILVNPGSRSLTIPEKVNNNGDCGASVTELLTVKAHCGLPATSVEYSVGDFVTFQSEEGGVIWTNVASRSWTCASAQAHELVCSGLFGAASNQTVNTVDEESSTVIAWGVSTRSAEVIFVNANVKEFRVLPSFNMV